MTSDYSGPAPAPGNPPHPNRLLGQTLAAGPLTRQRCAAIVAAAERLPSDEMPRIQRLAEVMDSGEREHVHRVWVALTTVSWFDAFDLLCAAGPDRDQA